MRLQSSSNFSCIKKPCRYPKREVLTGLLIIIRLNSKTIVVSLDDVHKEETLLLNQLNEACTDQQICALCAPGPFNSI